jgi:hypothetical protein
MADIRKYGKKKKKDHNSIQWYIMPYRRKMMIHGIHCNNQKNHVVEKMASTSIQKNVPGSLAIKH